MAVGTRRVAWLLLSPVLLACGMARRGAPRSNESLGARPSPSWLRPAAQETTFARLVERLSEPGGFFDSDNLISNETSYLHVLDAMHRVGVHGGVYVGVGPDQNFSYIADIKPSVALIIDIRRDNLLEHLLFKAMFAMSRDRAEYLSVLLGRPAPRDRAAWRERSIQDLIDYFDHAPADSAYVHSTQRELDARIARFGVVLTPVEVETIRRIRGAFVVDSLGIRYSSLGRAPRPYHPTYRQLLLEQDRSGHQANFLARDDAFQFVKSMEDRNLIIPVVGNVAGDKALVEIGRFVIERGEVVSAFYLSNVEQYLMRDGSFTKFAENLKQLPRNARSVIIRSFFGAPFGSGHPLNVPGHTSTSMLQTFDSFVKESDAGTLRSYFDLVGRNYLDP
jgi:hypothetical protein